MIMQTLKETDCWCSLKDISMKTSIKIEDIVSTLDTLGLLKVWRDQYVAAISKDVAMENGLHVDRRELLQNHQGPHQSLQTRKTQMDAASASSPFELMCLFTNRIRKMNSFGKKTIRLAARIAFVAIGGIRSRKRVPIESIRQVLALKNDVERYVLVKREVLQEFGCDDEGLRRNGMVVASEQQLLHHVSLVSSIHILINLRWTIKLIPSLHR